VITAFIDYISATRFVLNIFWRGSQNPIGGPSVCYKYKPIADELILLFGDNIVIFHVHEYTNIS